MFATVVFTTVSPGMLGAAGVIEISGLPAILILLAPVAVLLIIIARLSRRPRKSGPAPKAAPEAPAAVPAGAAAATLVSASIDEASPLDWAARIRSAEAENDQAALARLCLSAWRAEAPQGSSEAAAEYLRKAVRAAAGSRTKEVEAEARLALAELARAAGDLTTACEHWQLARALFHDLDAAARRDETETLMRSHGCPTDWVLNDF